MLHWNVHTMYIVNKNAVNSKLLNLIRQWTKKSLGCNQSILYFQQGIKYICWYSLKYDFHKVSAGINVSRKFLLAKTLKVICRRPAKINSAEKCRRQIVVAFSFLKILKWFPFSQCAVSKARSDKNKDTVWKPKLDLAFNNVKPKDRYFVLD